MTAAHTATVTLPDGRTVETVLPPGVEPDAGKAIRVNGRRYIVQHASRATAIPGLPGWSHWRIEVSP